MKEKLRAAMPFFGFLVSPVLTLVLTESYLYHPFMDMRWNPWFLNLAFYWLTAGLLFALTGRLRAALRIQTAFFMLAGLANYYVVAFRSSPILPWDIFSVGTAAEVADNFSYALPARCWLVLGGFLLLLALQQFFPYRLNQKKLRLAGTAAAFLLLAGMTAALHQDSTISKLRLYDKMFTPGVVQKRNGHAVAFLMELKYLFAQKPEGYEAAECALLLDEYDGNASESAADTGEDGVNVHTAKKPNIIVIMDEAFSDMADVGAFTANSDYMPFFHSLENAENTVSGRLHVSVLGGNTANTEFEFLTGNTMAFLPQGSIPYQQYIRREIPSLPSYLRRQGYQTVAMHPYHAAGWSRDKVYPWMDFEELYFLEDYPQASYVRKYVSDAADFERIWQVYEQRDKDRPLFLFNVTMQNHGGYDQEYENFMPEIYAEGIKSQSLSNYLSLISLSDRALQELIARFEKEQEPVMLVFFGDHQPNDTVAMPILQANGIRKGELSRQQEQARYQVPFVIWANYDIDREQNVETSANFLAARLLEQAGLPVNGYYGYLQELEKEYPVITAQQIRTADGQDLRGKPEEQAEKLLTYRQLQYYQMFDAPQSVSEKPQSVSGKQESGE